MKAIGTGPVIAEPVSDGEASSPDEEMAGAPSVIAPTHRTLGAKGRVQPARTAKACSQAEMPPPSVRAKRCLRSTLSDEAAVVPDDDQAKLDSVDLDQIASNANLQPYRRRSLRNRIKGLRGASSSGEVSSHDKDLIRRFQARIDLADMAQDISSTDFIMTSPMDALEERLLALALAGVNFVSEIKKAIWERKLQDLGSAACAGEIGALDKFFEWAMPWRKPDSLSENAQKLKAYEESTGFNPLHVHSTCLDGSEKDQACAFANAFYDRLWVKVLAGFTEAKDAEFALSTLGRIERELLQAPADTCAPLMESVQVALRLVRSLCFIIDFMDDENEADFESLQEAAKSDPESLDARAWKDMKNNDYVKPILQNIKFTHATHSQALAELKGCQEQLQTTSPLNGKMKVVVAHGSDVERWCKETRSGCMEKLEGEIGKIAQDVVAHVFSTESDWRNGFEGEEVTRTYDDLSSSLGFLEKVMPLDLKTHSREWCRAKDLLLTLKPVVNRRMSLGVIKPKLQAAKGEDIVSDGEGLLEVLSVAVASASPEELKNESDHASRIFEDGFAAVVKLLPDGVEVIDRASPCLEKLVCFLKDDSLKSKHDQMTRKLDLLRATLAAKQSEAHLMASVKRAQEEANVVVDQELLRNCASDLRSLQHADACVGPFADFYFHETVASIQRLVDKHANELLSRTQESVDGVLSSPIEDGSEHLFHDLLGGDIGGMQWTATLEAKSRKQKFASVYGVLENTALKISPTAFNAHLEQLADRVSSYDDDCAFFKLRGDFEWLEKVKKQLQRAQTTKQEIVMLRLMKTNDSCPIGLMSKLQLQEADAKGKKVLDCMHPVVLAFVKRGINLQKID